MIRHTRIASCRSSWRVVVVREPRRPTRHADVAMDMSCSRAQAAYAATVDNRRASHRWPHRLHRHPPPAASASLLKDSSVVWHSRHVACRRTTGSASRSAGAACDSGTLRTITYSRFGECEFGAAPVAMAETRLCSSSVSSRERRSRRRRPWSAALVRGVAPRSHPAGWPVGWRRERASAIPSRSESR